MVSRKLALSAFLVLAIAGIGITAYVFETDVSVSVGDRVVKLSQSSITVHMNASEYYTKNITVTSTKDLTVKIKVFPADYSTAKAWEKDFFATANPESLEVNPSGKTVTLVFYCDKPGKYRVKVVAVR